MERKVTLGFIGSGFIADIHAESAHSLNTVEIVGVASPTPGKAEDFAKRNDIPNHFTDYREMLKMQDLDLVLVCAPNHVHCEIVVDVAAAGKHIILEKPMCLNMREADTMIAACEEAKVKFMYAEELCFAPKYVRLKELLDSGALGEPTLVKQTEKHDGPHSPHFWDVDRCGGGAAMDLGCHAIEFFRWMLGRPKVKSVYAQLSTDVHRDKTKGDDNAIMILEFENGTKAVVENSWTKLGGMDDKSEVHGSKGVAYADLLQGTSIQTYSLEGYGYAVEKAGPTTGWSYTIFEEGWNYGFPQELAHFVGCVQNDKEPLVTGHDARAVMEVLFAAYQSAGTGQKVELPFHTDAEKPWDLWGGDKSSSSVAL